MLQSADLFKSKSMKEETISSKYIVHVDTKQRIRTIFATCIPICNIASVDLQRFDS